MSQNYCHHINATGAFCRGIPMKKRDYCFWHLNEAGRRMKAARVRAHSERVTIQLPVLDDLHAVQVGLMQLGEAIVHGEIDERRGRLLLAVLRQASSNLKARGDWLDEAQMQDEDDAFYVTENPGFEERYGLGKGFDLSVDPEVAFPCVPQVRDLPLGANLGSDNFPLNPNDGLNGAPVGDPELRAGAPYIPAVGMYGNEHDLRARLGNILRAAAAPIPGVDMQATADDMELMDVYERQGEQAGLQRATVLERNRKRRESRERRIRYEEMARNRNIQLAAEKLVADQQRKAEAGRQGSAEEHADTQSGRKPVQSKGNSSLVQAPEVGMGVA